MPLQPPIEPLAIFSRRRFAMRSGKPWEKFVHKFQTNKMIDEHVRRSETHADARFGFHDRFPTYLLRLCRLGVFVVVSSYATAKLTMQTLTLPLNALARQAARAPRRRTTAAAPAAYSSPRLLMWTMYGIWYLIDWFESCLEESL